jgi:hypothetical protein
LVFCYERMNNIIIFLKRTQKGNNFSDIKKFRMLVMEDLPRMKDQNNFIFERSSNNKVFIFRSVRQLKDNTFK